MYRCRHCRSLHNRPHNHRRGLCAKCYNAPDIRSLFTVKYPCLDHFRDVKPKEPTQAEIGSAEKIAAMAERVARGESVFHPRDNPQISQDAG